MIQFQSLVKKIETLKDKTLKIILETQELNDQDCAVLFSYRDAFIWNAMAKNEMKEADINIPDEPSEKWEKSLAQRQYNALYVLWQKKKEKGFKLDFTSYRQQFMEQHIENIKAKISEYD